jgi:hypothetical protein
MVKIGFDNEENLEQGSEDEISERKHGTQSNIREKKMSVYIPEKRIAEFLKNYDCVVVNDFGDDYHLSDEERKEKNACYEVFKNFSRCKHKYRRLDQYVIAMREFLKCLDYVSEKNGIYDPDKFKLMYLKDKIVIHGLFMPKFVGKEKKYISMDYLTEFILSDEDPSLIVQKKVDEVYTEEECKEFEETLFTKEELDRILAPETFEETKSYSLSFDEDDDQFERNIVGELSDKQLKKMIKNNPDFIKIFKDSKDKKKSLASLSQYAYSITSEDLDYIERYDRKHNFVSSSDVPEFHGNLMKDDDYNKYMMELDEWADENIYDNYHGKTKSLEDIRELELKLMLEQNGWNLRNLYNNAEKEKKLKKQLKRDKKREAELRQKLVDISNRRSRRMGEPVKIEKSKFKKKSKKNKKIKAAKKEKNRLEETMNDFIDASYNTSKDSMDWT